MLGAAILRYFLASLWPSTKPGCWTKQRLVQIDIDTMSNGVTRVGVTRGGNWRCHPYFSRKKLTTFLSLQMLNYMALTVVVTGHDCVAVHRSNIPYVCCVRLYVRRRTVCERSRKINVLAFLLLLCFMFLVCSLYVLKPTQPSIPPGSVNEYQLRLGRQRQVWFIPLADERGVCR